MLNIYAYKISCLLSKLQIIYFLTVFPMVAAAEEQDLKSIGAVAQKQPEPAHPIVRKSYLNRDLYATVLAVEYEEGEKAGLEKGEKLGLEKSEKLGEKKVKRAAITQMKSMNMQDSIIAQALQITEEELHVLMDEEENA